MVRLKYIAIFSFIMEFATIMLPIFMIIRLIIKNEKSREEYRESSYYKVTHNEYKSTYSDKGKFGEYDIYRRLRQQEILGGKFLFNLYIPKEKDKTTEIDVLLINTKGIFVIESKNYSGWIFGDRNSRKWVQMLSYGYGQKNYFYNPILQNKTHIEYLKKIVKLDIPMYSIIVFSDECELKKVPDNSNRIKIVKRNQLEYLVNSINSMSGDIIESERVDNIYNMLYKYSQVDDNVKEKHISDINSFKI